VVQSDALQLLGIRGWRRRAENRDEWRHLMREAKGLRGCSAIYGWNIFHKNKNRNSGQSPKTRHKTHSRK